MPYMVGQSRYSLVLHGPVEDYPTMHSGLSKVQSDRAVPYPRHPAMCMQNREMHHVHNSHMYSSSIIPSHPTSHYVHTIPPHAHGTEYSSASREPERHQTMKVVPVVHQIHIWNILGLKAGTTMHDPLMSSSLSLVDGRHMLYKK
jgi:hypothetical protein